MKRDIRSRLISRDPKIAFTSGQWMTERPGGSDISQTETVATLQSPNSSSGSPATGAPYKLDGFKWFSSATDSEVSVALARTGPLSQGSRGLSLFLVPLRLPLLPTPSPNSISNGILVHRLKNKFGTQALPTAELSLNDTTAYLLSPLNKGVRTIAPVLNITRVHSAVGGVGGLSRAFAIARSYATVRTVNDSASKSNVLLKNVPLHISTLAKIGVTYQALAHFTFGIVALLGKSECEVASKEEEQRVRLLTPVMKGFVSDRGVAAIEECMGCLGGQGYMEENVIARIIRDVSVERIWEGTLSVMALDLIRASKGKLGIQPLIDWANIIISSTPFKLISSGNLSNAIDSLKSALTTIHQIFTTQAVVSPFIPRPFLFLVGHLAASIFLLEHATWAFNTGLSTAGYAREAQVFKRWTEDGLELLRLDVVKASKIADLKGRHRDDLEIIYGNKGDVTAKL
ncbi:hypothetical protein M422DRAFT_35386 [Sphaerobolus stellatus SS14]|uniref:Acyl-CoA dehydrogenase/oxidase C-terminal domain-containing protein n=1 Tax=Sphaerobolus stellatus (strain SS14) TaxID=990650 RepID=A0A0C9V8V3_SPHS4|nr:hypothetical protein M422DRAFT_35386 [Sphaerobolus stellatus SS14]